MFDDEIARFRARWSVTVWVMTLLILALAAYLLILGFSSMPGDDFQRLMGLIFAGILGIAVLFAPRAFYVTKDSVIVKRSGTDLVIKIQDIDQIRRIRLREFGFSIRTFGVGGFFGYYGKFYSRQIGSHNAYATNCKSLVLIQCTNGKKYVLSPEHADKFVEMVKRNIQHKIIKPDSDINPIG